MAEEVRISVKDIRDYDIKPTAIVNGFIICLDSDTDKVYKLSIDELKGQPESVVQWNPTTSYDLDFIVEYNSKLWKSEIANNSNNTPSSGSIYWEEVSKSEANGFGRWSAGVYTIDPTVVINGNSLYILSNTVSLPYESSDFNAELAAGDWVSIGGNVFNFIDFIEQATPPAQQDYRLFADATAVSATGLNLGTGQIEIEKTDSTDRALSQLFAGGLEEDIPDQGTGYALKYAFLRGFNTSSWNIKDRIYVDPESPGALTNIEPTAPNYTVLVGTVSFVNATAGIISCETRALTASDTSVNIEGSLNGMATQTPDVNFVVSGGVIYADVTNKDEPTKNLPFLIGSDLYKLDTLAGGGAGGAARATIPAGTDYENMQPSTLYIYLNSGVPTLTAATTEPPIPFVKIGQQTASNATDTDTDGIFMFRLSNNAVDLKNGVNDGGVGIIKDIIEAIREKLGSNWISGQDGTPTVNNTTIKLALSAGIGRQFRRSNIPAFDGNLYRIYNDISNNVTYATSLNLTDITQTAGGTTDDLLSNNRFYTIRIFYMLNSDGTVDRVIATRPSGFYTTPEEAISDPNGYAVAVNDTDIEEIIYPVYDLVIGRTGTGGTTITLEQLTDRRTKLAQGAGGGGASGGAGTDDKVRISSNDTVNSYLIDKVVAGSGVTLATLNPGGNEQLEISASAGYPPIQTATAWDGSSYVISMSDSDTFERTINDLTTALTFGVSGISVDDRIEVLVTIDNKTNNTVAISTITFPADFIFAAYERPTGMAIGEVATLRLESARKSAKILATWTIDEV
jgi:hypothetical protein